MLQQIDVDILSELLARITAFLYYIIWGKNDRKITCTYINIKYVYIMTRKVYKQQEKLYPISKHLQIWPPLAANFITLWEGGNLC